MNSPSSAVRPDPHRWIVFSVICMVYFFVYFHRVSTSVIAADLLKAFQTGAAALGGMSSMYFYLYAFEQPVVGWLTDRLGARRVIGYWSLAAAGGCFVFGLAPGIGWAAAGRALIGIGVGGVYVPAIKAFSLWFDKRSFSTMIGLLMSVGNFGAVIATTPLAWASAAWGWRLTFFLIGGITLGLAAVTLFCTRDHASESIPETPAAPDTPGGKSGFRQALTSGQFWIIAVIFFGIYGPLVTLQGLWAAPFLMTAFEIGKITASQLNMLIPVGVITGAPFFGWLPGRFSIDLRSILIFIIVMYTLTWAGIVYGCPFLGLRGISVSLLVMGIAAGGFISVLWGIVRETTPERILGITSGLLNPAPFPGVAAFQMLTGIMLDRTSDNATGGTLAAFTDAFLPCLLSSLVCLCLSLMICKASPRSD